VAENSGCISQPGKRCMANRGVDAVRMAWGEPRSRPFKGFSVRVFEWINATWPHPEHKFVNAGRDASSLVTIVPCLFSHLPQTMDLLLIEAGSMALTTKASTLEHLTRQVLSMRMPPTVAFVTVHIWCVLGGSIRKRVKSYGLNKLPEEREYRFWADLRPGGANTSVPTGPDFSPDTWNPSDEIEKAIDEICERYGAACISQRNAVKAVLAQPGFGIREIAGDCLHPVHGSLGTEIMADLLVHWIMRATERHTELTMPDSKSHLLPPPIRKQMLVEANRKAACYHLAESGTPDSVSALPWHTSFCAPTGRSQADMNLHSREVLEAGCKQHMDAACPRVYQPPYLTQRAYREARVPKVWTFCTRAVGGISNPAAKLSPGVVAFQPGATLFIPLPTSWLSRSDNSSSTLPVGFNVTLQHIVSWRAMGIARIACTDSCTCDTHELDAHASFATRNVTVFTEHRVLVSLKWPAAGAGATTAAPLRCGLLITVLPRTSSGGHMFKLRDVVLYTSASPCDTTKDKLRIMRVRSNLRCSEPQVHRDPNS
jgi:hypothetical protein